MKTEKLWRRTMASATTAVLAAGLLFGAGVPAQAASTAPALSAQALASAPAAQTGFSGISSTPGLGVNVSTSQRSSLKKLKTTKPKIQGTLAVGNTVTAKLGTWTHNTTMSYQWYANGKKINGATKKKYKIGSSQAGKRLTVKVSGKKYGFSSASQTSAKSLKVLKAGTPSISGTAQVSKSLTAKLGSWSSNTKFTYQWYSDGKRVSGANKKKYTVGPNQAGKRITVKVTGKKSGYATITKTSKSTSAVKKAASQKSSSGNSSGSGKSSSGGSSTSPKNGSWDCPSGYPVKGNHSSSGEWIYHVPGGQFYSRTNPEQCFKTESAAKNAGYRKSKR